MDWGVVRIVLMYGVSIAVAYGLWKAMDTTPPDEEESGT